MWTRKRRSRRTSLDYSGGSAIAHRIWSDLDADTLCDRGVVIAGNPDSCIEALKKHEAIGIDQMMIMMQTETVPHEQVMESIELFGKYVDTGVQERGGNGRFRRARGWDAQGRERVCDEGAGGAGGWVGRWRWAGVGVMLRGRRLRRFSRR